MKNLIFKLFHLCFETGKIPAVWAKGIIAPTPKGSMKNVYLSRSQFGRVCRRGVIFKKIGYWFPNTHLEASHWF